MLDLSAPELCRNPVGDGTTKQMKRVLNVLKTVTSKVVVPAVMSLAKEIPIIGRISNLLSKVGDVVQGMQDQDGLVQDLRDEIMNVREALQFSQETSQYDGLDLTESRPLLRLKESIEDALKALSDISNRGKFLGVIFFEPDNNKIKGRISNLKETLQSFCQSVPLYRERVEHQQRMRKLLHYPKVFHSAIQDHLSRFQPGSRQWLFEEVNHWLTRGSSPVGVDVDVVDEGHFSRMFWIRADPGMGKSAFAAALTKKLKDENLFLGAYFCQYTSSNESASKIIRSWAAQSCENLAAVPGSFSAKGIFEQAFCEWDSISEGDKPSESELFEMLLTNPLREYANHTVSAQNHHNPMVLLIDALDEVSSSNRDSLLHILSSKLQDLPPWVKVVVTSRPEADIVHAFARLKPTEIKEDDPRHSEDIRLFVESKLREVMDAEHLKSGIALFLERSEGRFIYVSSVIEEILKKSRLSKWSLSDLNNRLPENGLIGWYREFFVRMKARDVKYFEEVIFPVVKLIICSKGHLTLGDAKMILNHRLSVPEEQRLIDELHQLFPLRSLNPSQSQVFVPFHKSVFDWLTNEDWSGSYADGKPRDNFFISTEEGNQIFVDFFRTLFVSEWLDEGDLSRRPVPGSYFYRHAFDHFRDSSSPGDVLFGVDQLFRLRVLASLLEERGVREIIRVIRSFLISSSSSGLSVLCQLLELSAPAFRMSPVDVDALPFQILARMTPSQSNDPSLRLQELHRECENWRSLSEKGYWLKPVRNYLASAGGSLEKIITLGEVSSS
jgi:hypothetical protein